MSNGNGKTTTKEVCSQCKCIVQEKPLEQKSQKKKEEKKENNCVATIVGVLSLPENFCCDKKNDSAKEKDSCLEDAKDTKKKSNNNDICGEKNGEKTKEKSKKKDDCTDVYRDLGECLQKCIAQGAKSKKSEC